MHRQPNVPAAPTPPVNPTDPDRTISRQRASRMMLALMFASSACFGMLMVRLAYSGRVRYSFLIWNLLLAWVPLVFSVAAYRLHGRAGRHWLTLAVCAACWFIFFPNAPYIVTDFIHLVPSQSAPYSALDAIQYRRAPMKLLWYDLLILMSFAWTGLFLGYLSLYLMQEIARRRFGAWASWYFVGGVLAASSFGIYLGRFLRWNSWDVLRHPWSVFADSVRSIDPFARPAPLAFCATIFVFLALSYGALYCLTHLHAREAGR